MGNIMNKLHSAISYMNDELLKGVIIDERENTESQKDLSITTLVDRAHKEWVQAKNFFNEVNDPELIDHAIYAMVAAERKYIYLLKLAKKEQSIAEVTQEKTLNEYELG